MKDNATQLTHYKIKKIRHICSKEKKAVQSYSTKLKERFGNKRLSILSIYKSDNTYKQSFPQIVFSNSMVDLSVRQNSNNPQTPQSSSSRISLLKRKEYKSSIEERDKRMQIDKRDQQGFNRKDKRQTDWLNKSTEMIKYHFCPSGINKPLTHRDDNKKGELTKDQILNEIYQIQKNRNCRSSFQVLPLINRKILLLNQMNKKQRLKDQMPAKGLEFTIERRLFVNKY